jgi:hypothetical protein
LLLLDEPPALRPEVFTLTIALLGPYPSGNHTGNDSYRGGRKSPEYKQLFRRIREAAREEMERIGWTTIEAPACVEIVRTLRYNRRTDPQNIGKLECDALERDLEPNPRQRYRIPFAGVYSDDRYVIPDFRLGLDPDGPERLIITVRRDYPHPASAVTGGVRGRAGAARAALGETAAPVLARSRRATPPEPGDAIVPGAFANGKPLTQRDLDRYLRRMRRS